MKKEKLLRRPTFSVLWLSLKSNKAMWLLWNWTRTLEMKRLLDAATSMLICPPLTSSIGSMLRLRTLKVLMTSRLTIATGKLHIRYSVLKNLPNWTKKLRSYWAVKLQSLESTLLSLQQKFSRFKMILKMEEIVMPLNSASKMAILSSLNIMCAKWSVTCKKIRTSKQMKMHKKRK